MKKHDEGYVLAFVLVVIVVLCLVAVSMMSISLRNVQTQTDSIVRMQDKYTAMGLIEKLNAVTNANAPKIPVNAITASDAIKNALAVQGVSVEVTNKSGENNEFTSFSADVKIVSECEAARVECTYLWKGNLEKDEDASKYYIDTTTWDCTSYKITTASPTEPEVTP